MPSAQEIEELLRARAAELRPAAEEYDRIMVMLGTRRASSRPRGGHTIAEVVVEAVRSLSGPSSPSDVYHYLRALGHDVELSSVSNSMNALTMAKGGRRLRRVARGLYDVTDQED